MCNEYNLRNPSTPQNLSLIWGPKSASQLLCWPLDAQSTQDLPRTPQKWLPGPLWCSGLLKVSPIPVFILPKPEVLGGSLSRGVRSRRTSNTERNLDNSHYNPETASRTEQGTHTHIHRHTPLYAEKSTHDNNARSTENALAKLSMYWSSSNPGRMDPPTSAYVRCFESRIDPEPTAANRNSDCRFSWPEKGFTARSVGLSSFEGPSFRRIFDIA